VICLMGGLYLLLASGRVRLEPLLAPLHSLPPNNLPTSSLVPGAPTGPGQMRQTWQTGQLQTIALDSMVVNLADPGGRAYLRLGLALVVEGSAAPAASAEGGGAKAMASLPREQEIPIRDTVLAVLGEQTSQALLAPEGRERLKQALLAALAAQHPELRVQGLYFSELLVQP
jgi:flagellar FliL protein